MGLLTKDDGSQPEVKKSNPLLALRFKYAVTDPERTRRLTAPFARLFNPVLVVAVTCFGSTCNSPKRTTGGNSFDGVHVFQYGSSHGCTACPLLPSCFSIGAVMRESPSCHRWRSVEQPAR